MASPGEMTFWPFKRPTRRVEGARKDASLGQTRGAGTVKLTIVGLGLLGTSLGLALKTANPSIQIMGHDPDSDLVKRAKKLGAIDQSHWNLPAACAEAELIVLDLPLDELQKTLAALKDALREGALLIDTAPIKAPVLAWAKEFLPQTVQFVGGHIVSPQLIWGQAEPSAALLQGATFYLVPPAGASPWALEKAANLATAVGANPYFTDAAEHDGIAAASVQLPILAAVALANLSQREAGRQERAKAVSGEWLGLGAMLLASAPGFAQGALANRENLQRWLELYLAELSRLRDLLVAANAQALAQEVDRAEQASASWLGGQEPPPLAAEQSSTWQQFFLGSLGRRRPPQEDAKR